MTKPKLKPLAGGSYKIELPENYKGGEWDMAYLLDLSRTMEQHGDIEGACNVRFEAVQRLMEFLPDDQEINLEWEAKGTADLLFMLNSSAVDHFLATDFEMSAGMLETSLDLDPEDHLEATIMLAYNYVALDEEELFDEIINDISDKYADKVILKMWSEFRRTGAIPEGELRHFKHHFKEHHTEFCRNEHPVSDTYLNDIEAERPSREALARELWLRTENLWNNNTNFISAIKAL